MKITFVFLMLLPLLTCNPLSKESPKNASNQPPIREKNLATMNLLNQEGIIGYWEDLKKYTINFSQAGYDAQITGIIDGALSDNLKKQGTKVVFSGKLYQNAETPKPMMGGQQVFWLTLEAIQPK
jgi:hypothetical protein